MKNKNPKLLIIFKYKVGEKISTQFLIGIFNTESETDIESCTSEILKSYVKI